MEIQINRKDEIINIFSKENIQRALKESTEDQRKEFFPEKKKVKLIPFIDKRGLLILSIVLFCTFIYLLI